LLTLRETPPGIAPLLIEAFYYDNPDNFAALTDDEERVEVGGALYPSLLVRYARALALGAEDMVRGHAR
jgi:hypothetical protein